MFLKAAVNGGRMPAEAPTVPLTPEQIAVAAARAVELGASVVHAHARTRDGGQTLHPDSVAAMVTAVRRISSSVILGTTTGLWTCSGHRERMELVSRWPDEALPDFASVAFFEDGAADAAQLVLDRGMVLESAVWSMADVRALLDSPTRDDNVRVLIEPETEDGTLAVAECRAIAQRLRSEGMTCSLLYHGYDRSAWPVLQAALEDGVEARIGLEDVIELPDGTPGDNDALIIAASRFAYADSI